MATRLPPAAVVLPTTPQALYDVDGPKRHTSHLGSPPHTPPSPVSRAARRRGKSQAAKRRPAVRETFHNARGDTGGYNRNRSDSHDLSWSPRQTRDSVVDNMLLSLDQLFVPSDSTNHGSSTTYFPFTAEDPCSAPPHPTTFRGCGHNIPSPVSSELDIPRDGIDPQNPTSPTRRQRSNSSTNHQSALGRIDSVRVMEEAKVVNTVKQLPGNQRMGGPGGRSIATSSSRRKGSKSSGSSSMDFGQMMAGPRWQRAVERRSSSFDHGCNNQTSVLAPETSAFVGNPINTSRSQTVPYHNDDAAPTPTIPGGPRGASGPLPPATTFPLKSGGSTSQPSPLRRKHSKRAPATSFMRHEAVDGMDTGVIQGASGSRLHSRAVSKDVSAGVGSTNTVFPNPRTQIYANVETVSHSSTGHARERPGFFRRVFGSSRNTIPVANGLQMSQTHSLSSYPGSRAESRSGQNMDSVRHSRVPRISPVAIVAKDSFKDLPQAPLNKKSSFFRRRKKSLSDGTPLPLPSVLVQHQLHPSSAMAVQASPVSSLRKVMNPYLSSPATASTLRERSDSSETALESSTFPLSLPPNDSRSNLYHTTAVTDTGNLGTLKEDSSLPVSRYNANTGGLTSSEPLISSQRIVDRGSAQPADSDDTLLQGGDKGSSFTEWPPNSNCVSDSTRAEEDPTISASMSHSRSGSDKELPKLPKEVQLLPELDNNTPKPKFPAIITRKTTGKDWNGASILLTPTKDGSSPNSSSQRSPRVWLRPTASEEDLRCSAQIPPPDDPVRASADSIPSDYKSATSKLPTPTVEITPQPQDLLDGSHDGKEVSHGGHEMLDLDSVEPTTDDRSLAKRIFEGDDDTTEKPGAAAWLGDWGVNRARVRTAYMELFNWQNLNILAALRSFCGRLLLKGETQQVDRILFAFSARWCICNPNHGFKATGE